MAKPPDACFNRRGFLVATAATPLAGFVGTASAQPAPAQPAAGPAPAPPTAEEGARLWLNNVEADTLTALVDRLIPSSDSGPGAVEVGVVTYIDRQLAGNLGAASTWYMRGPFAEGAPSQGWQLALTPAALYRLSLAEIDRVVQAEHGRAVRDLDAGQRDALLARMEKGELQLGGVSSSVFFEFLLGNTVEGYFADPLYGGNRGGVNWKRIGYPGANPVLTEYVGDKTPPEVDPVSIG